MKKRKLGEIAKAIFFEEFNVEKEKNRIVEELFYITTFSVEIEKKIVSIEVEEISEFLFRISSISGVKKEKSDEIRKKIIEKIKDENIHSWVIEELNNYYSDMASIFETAEATSENAKKIGYLLRNFKHTQLRTNRENIVVYDKKVLAKIKLDFENKLLSVNFFKSIYDPVPNTRAFLIKTEETARKTDEVLGTIQKNLIKTFDEVVSFAKNYEKKSTYQVLSERLVFFGDKYRLRMTAIVEDGKLFYVAYTFKQKQGEYETIITASIETIEKTLKENIKNIWKQKRMIEVFKNKSS